MGHENLLVNLLIRCVKYSLLRPAVYSLQLDFYIIVVRGVIMLSVVCAVKCQRMKGLGVGGYKI